MTADAKDERDPSPAPQLPAPMDPTPGVDRGDRVHEFRAPGVSVTWSRRRCIHVAACVMNLPRVFEPGRRPWVEATLAPPETIARVVGHCPTGALHCTLEDGAAEAAPAENTVSLSRNGPTYAHGAIEVRDETGALKLVDTRVAICRCGRSSNKPLCDGTHLVAGFHDAGSLGDGSTVTDTGAADRTLRIQPQRDGPLVIEGPFSLTSADRRAIVSGTRVRLCRCGQSRAKPFCDGSHQRAEFRSG